MIQFRHLSSKFVSTTQNCSNVSKNNTSANILMLIHFDKMNNIKDQENNHCKHGTLWWNLLNHEKNTSEEDDYDKSNATVLRSSGRWGHRGRRSEETFLTISPVHNPRHYSFYTVRNRPFLCYSCTDYWAPEYA